MAGSAGVSRWGRRSRGRRRVAKMKCGNPPPVCGVFALLAAVLAFAYPLSGARLRQIQQDLQDRDTAAEFFDQTLKFSARPKGPEAYVVETPWEGLHLMPSHPTLDELHSKLESRYKIYKLRDALNELSDTYDHIYIDTPPALNFYTRSALIAAQG